MSATRHDLTFRRGYYGDGAVRPALNELAYRVFDGFDLTPWSDLGHGLDSYTPFSLFDGDRVVANVSASPMNLVVDGEELPAFQIGTVATAPEHRRGGLIRDLMARAHEYWNARRNFSFLFANETVLEFYQQFGYRPVAECAFLAAPPHDSPPAVPARRLDLARREDRELLIRLAGNREPVSSTLGVHRQSWLLLFHAAVGHPGDLWYLEPLNVVVIATVKRNVLRLVDVVGESIPTLTEFYPFLGASGVETVEFGFTPDRMDVDSLQVETAGHSHLFVRGEFRIEGERFRFPETSRS